MTDGLVGVPLLRFFPCLATLQNRHMAGGLLWSLAEICYYLGVNHDRSHSLPMLWKRGLGDNTVWIYLENACGGGSVWTGSFRLIHKIRKNHVLRQCPNASWKKATAKRQRKPSTFEEEAKGKSKNIDSFLSTQIVTSICVKYSSLQKNAWYLVSCSLWM